MSTLLLVLFVFMIVNALSYKYTCNYDQDCELLGKCVNNACQCKPGWTGETCGTLNLGKAPGPPKFGVWPLKGSHNDKDTYSWGFTIIKPLNSNDNTYHAWVNQGCYNTSMGQVSGCFLLHVTSKSPTSNFIAQDIMIPPSSFNPHIIYSKLSKQYLMFFRINDLNQWPICVGNDSISLTNYNKLTPNSMDIGASSSPFGPWEVTTVTIENMAGIHISNPSAIQLSNGTYIMAYRFNTNAEHVGIASTLNGIDYKGPYYNIANFSVPGEDPFIWQNIQDGINVFHVIFHVENQQAYSEWPSLHAWSTNLFDWNVSQSYKLFQEGAYSTNVTWSDNSITTFYRRERPEIMFDDNGIPIYFYTAVQEFKTPNVSFGYSYSVVQDIVTE